MSKRDEFVAQMQAKLEEWNAEIDELEARLAKTEEGTQTHSDYLRRLIALQQEKRSSGQ